VALAECAVAGDIGVVVSGITGHAELFSESPGRVLVGTSDPDAVVTAAVGAGVPATVIGRAQGERLVVDGLVDLAVSEVRRAWRAALPLALGEPVPA